MTTKQNYIDLEEIFAAINISTKVRYQLYNTQSHKRV